MTAPAATPTAAITAAWLAISQLTKLRCRWSRRQG
jgi:hypothetical protein